VRGSVPFDFFAYGQNLNVDRPSRVLVVLSGILALVIAGIGWPVVQHVITIAHEGAHATAGSTMGRRVLRVLLRRTGGGETQVSPLGGRLTMAAIASAGYLGPSFFGILGSLVLFRTHAEAVLWISLVLLAILLPQVANWFGRFSVVLTAAVLVVVVRYAPDGLQTLFAFTWIWFLLIGGFVQVLVLRQYRRGMKAKNKRTRNPMRICSGSTSGSRRRSAWRSSGWPLSPG
jgi:hypothetical protein